MPARDLKQVNADGAVVSGSSYLHSVTLTPDGTNAASVAIQDGASGSARLTLRCAGAGPSVCWRAGHEDGVLFSTSIYADLTGTGAVACVEFS